MPRTLTTGEVARACGVSPRTVVKWIQQGWLKGHKVPGSAHRRVLPQDWAEFVREHGMPESFVDESVKE